MDDVKEMTGYNTCQTCMSGGQWMQPVSRGLTLGHPAYACKNPESPKVGFWLTPICSCELYQVDEERIRAMNKPKSVIQVPNKIGKKLRIGG